MAEDLRLPKRQENPPRTWVGQKKKQRQKNRDGICTSGRELERRKSFPLGRHFTGGDGGWEGVSFGAMEESTATGVQRAKWRDFRTEERYRRGLESEARASVRAQGEDWVNIA